MRPKELWILLFFIGTLAFGWPFLEIFASELPIYLFTAWICIIALIYIVVKYAAKEQDEV
jgi:uncharacterized membrane protein HdeD (DUF308 family)